MSANQKFLLFSALSILGLTTAFAGGFFQNQRRQPIQISEWPVFHSDTQHLIFQYPPGWSVTSESNGVLRVSPPNAETRFADSQGDGDSIIYGIRIAPFETYPALPTNLRESDLSTHLRRINSYSFKVMQITENNADPALLVYDLEEHPAFMVLYKKINKQIFQIELGRHFEASTFSDKVDFFGVASTLRAI